jgi:hypothetical protein
MLTALALVRRAGGRVSLCFAGVVLLSISASACAQETDLDPARVFVTVLHWQRAAGPSHGEGLRYADGTLVIFYREGVYAEVATSFTKTGSKLPIVLNLTEGSVVRLGTWSRTEDDVLIHVVSREVARGGTIPKGRCQETTNDRICPTGPEAASPGPSLPNTCRLEHPSTKHIADAIVCNGLTVFHPQRPIDLGDFPSVVHQLCREQKSEPKSSARGD